MVLRDREFSALYPSGEYAGLSLCCVYCGYSRNVSRVASGMTDDECANRLLQWEGLCPVRRKLGGEHKDVGGNLLAGVEELVVIARLADRAKH